MRYLCTILLLAALGAAPGCTATLGSRAADTARAQDVGSTIGTAASAIPGAQAVGALASPLTDLAGREAQRRIDAAPEGQPIGLWTQILLGVNALGTALLGAKSLAHTKATNELYDDTKALSIKIAGTLPGSLPKA